MSDTVEQKEETQVKGVPENAKFKVYWYDRPENYNRDNRLKIKNDIAKKYGVASENIKVIFRHSETDKHGNKIELNNSDIENVLDVNYQKELFKEWVKREEKSVDFDRLMKLDDTINSKVDFDFDKELNKTWKLKSLEVNNFLSFGEGNKISFDDINGFTVVTSSPENQGGKTSFCLDSIKFLLYGSTTKTTKNKQVFNDYSDNNKLSVKGEIEIDGQSYFIERKLSKSESSSGNMNVNSSVNYYKIGPDGSMEQLNEEDTKQTQNKIYDAVGREKDFEAVTMASDKTLENLIDSTPTENGKLLNRFIGLEILSEKESKVREEYNAFAKKMTSNTYDAATLSEEIEEHNEKIDKANKLIEEKNKQLEKVKEELQQHGEKRDELNTKKNPIDESLKNVDKDKLDRELKEIEDKGKELKNKKQELESQIKEIGDVSFDEDRHIKLNTDLNEKKQKVIANENEIERINKEVKELENSQVCPTCKRPLEDVDHSDDIKKKNEKVKELEEEKGKVNKEVEKIEEELKELKGLKDQVDKKNKLEIERDRIDVELGTQRTNYKDKEGLKEKFDQNISNINENKEIDKEIEKVKSQLEVKDGEKNQIIKGLETLNNEISTNTKEVENKNELIRKIEKEKEVERLYKIYIEMLGKTGVRKIVLRSVLPTINSELDKLLDDVTDFTVGLDINHKDEVELNIYKGGSERLLKSASGYERVSSSLALRSVLGKVSNLPTPNFIIFDEVLGKVGESNMPYMKDLLEKVTDMHETVFFISHSNTVKDWADNVISVVNENNISKLDINNKN